MVDRKAELWSIYYRTNIVLSVPYWIHVKLCLLKMTFPGLFSGLLWCRSESLRICSIENGVDFLFSSFKVLEFYYR